MLETCIRRRRVFVPVFLGLCAASFLLIPWLGRDFFPLPTRVSSTCTSAPKPARASKKPPGCGDLIETSMREIIPPSELASIIDNIGLPYSSINTAYSNSAPIGTMDADVLVT